ncbi:MAG: cellulase family glycosylhydrolase [Capsulimonadaceae bacterium]|nr:cellulase family glycosylhydrolase [Capsulimonadaceae bacterium]
MTHFRLMPLLVALIALAIPATAADLAPLRVDGPNIVANGHPIRLRGLDWGWWHLAGTQYTEADMKSQAQWGTNVARLAFTYSDLEDAAHPGTWREDGFRQFDDVIRWAKKYGIYVILDMHVAQGGQDPSLYEDGGGNKIWRDSSDQERFIALWREIARRYRDRPEVAAYELMNEPDTRQFNPSVLTALYERAIAAIRKVDPDKIVVMTGDHYSGAKSLNDAVKLPESNILYTFHFYDGMPVGAWLGNAAEGPGIAGTQDWKRIEVDLKAPAGASAMSIMLRSTKNAGTAWFDDVRLEDASGNVVRSNSFDLGADPYSPERLTAGTVSYDPVVGHDKPGSLRVSGTDAYNGWTSNPIKTSPGRKYKLSAWVKLDNATGETYLSAAFMGTRGDAKVDPASLRPLMQGAIDFKRKYNVPVWVGEFGCEAGSSQSDLQKRWVSSCIDLFEEAGFEWTYWNYRETTGPDTMAVHAEKKDGSDYPVNEALVATLSKGWALNARNTK